MASRWLLIALAVGILASAGCEDEYPADLRYEFHPYPSFNKQANQKELLGEDFDEATRSEIAGYLEPYFGTPRDPKVEISAELQNHPELQLDPAILKQGSRLYRNLCLYCHGIVGDGNGPTGQFLNPKPRDFRQGWFKFRSTVRVSRSSGKPETAFPVTPSRADLLKTIRHGIPTASMPSFQLLNEADLNALVSYVIHQSGGRHGQPGGVACRELALWRAEVELSQRNVCTAAAPVPFRLRDRKRNRTAAGAWPGVVRRRCRLCRMPWPRWPIQRPRTADELDAIQRLG